MLVEVECFIILVNAVYNFEPLHVDSELFLLELVLPLGVDVHGLLNGFLLLEEGRQLKQDLHAPDVTEAES